MITLIDSSLWIDFARVRTPMEAKHLIAPYILSPSAAVAEPIVFELLRDATDEEGSQLWSQFQTMPLLATPANLWAEAARLGQACGMKGVTAGTMDLLISAIAIHHEAELITFEAAYESIAAVSNLRVKLLERAG
jgi:predicted nucleic acid-binding protein